jgi:hypothetical protein
MLFQSDVGRIIQMAKKQTAALTFGAMTPDRDASTTSFLFQTFPKCAVRVHLAGHFLIG